MPEGAIFAQVFETPGVFDYFCAIHPEMRGTVTVAEPGAAAEPSPVPVPTVSDAPALDLPVSIVDMVYAPSTVEVSAGTTVHWRNDDAVVHTVTARDGSFNSGVMKTGVEFSQSFDEPGTYDYFCAIHPLQGGTVIVTDPGD
jgi:plastocyanin